MACLVYLLCLAPSLFSQQNMEDSLLAVIKHAGQDTNKVNALNALARHTLNKSIEQARQYAERSLSLAKTLSADSSSSSLRGLANAYHILGVITFYEDDFLKALDHYSASLAIRLKINDRQGIAASYNNMAIIYNDFGNYKEALQSHYASLKIEEENGNKQAAGLSYNNIGIVNEVLEEYPEAIKNYEKAIALGREVNDKLGMANAYNNIGIVLKKQGRYDEALRNYNIALDLRKEVGYPKGIFESYNNIAIVYYTLGNYEEALKNHELSLAISTRNNYELGAANTRLNIGLVYLKQKKFAQSEPLLKEALRYYQNIQYKQNIVEAYEALTALYNDQGNYKKGMEYMRLYVAQKDSLLNSNTKRELLQSSVRYEYEKKEAIARVEQEKKEAIHQEELEKKATQVKLYIALCILILIIFAGVFLQMRNRRRTEKLKLENSLIELEQKALRLQMNPHFIFNALNSIQGFIIDNDRLSARKYLVKFARLMRLIMENSARKTVSLQNEINVLDDYLELTTLRFPGKFSFEISKEEPVDADACEIPPMLLQPFVENAVLHGLAARGEGGLLTVRFQKKDNHLECLIEDNGIGRGKAMQNKLHSHKSTGMLVTEERLKAFGEQQEMQTRLQIIDLFDTFGNGCGTRVVLEIPMQPQWK